MRRDELFGVWELISCEGRSADGASFLPYGAQPVGKLIYTEDGHLAVTLMNSSREQFVSEDISKATSDEVVAAFNTFDSYSGRWRFHEEADSVEHIIESGRIPNWVAKTHLRNCATEDGLLTLSTDEFEMGGKVWRVYVTWKRPTSHNN
jgi:hypothetical protein